PGRAARARPSLGALNDTHRELDERCMARRPCAPLRSPSMASALRRSLLGALLFALAYAAAPARADGPVAAPQNRPPSGTFTWTPAAPRSGDTVTFTAQATDPDGDPVTAG